MAVILRYFTKFGSFWGTLRRSGWRCCRKKVQYYVKRLARKNVSELTYFVLSETKNLNSINHSSRTSIEEHLWTSGSEKRQEVMALGSQADICIKQDSHICKSALWTATVFCHCQYFNHIYCIICSSTALVWHFRFTDCYWLFNFIIIRFSWHWMNYNVLTCRKKLLAHCVIVKHINL